MKSSVRRFQPLPLFTAHAQLTCRDAANTTTTILALSYRSVHEPQHCTQGSARRNSGVAFSGSDYQQMEVYWLSIVDSRKACVSFIISGERLLTDSNYLSGLWEKRHLVRFLSPAFAWSSPFSSSSVIQDIMALCKTGFAIMAYFYFDFKDLRKQTCHDLLLSLLSQLSTRSAPYCDILYRVYEEHDKGTRQPSDDTLKECLKQMLTLPSQRPIYIVLDALDECPDCSGLPPPRTEVLQLVKELVDLRLHGLYICATSRPEVDIRAVLEPLAFRSVSLHDESGQKADIADYVRNIVNSSPSTAMRRWRADDKNLVIETLTERADGM